MLKFEFTEEEKVSLERLGAETVILFGSHAEGIAGPMSDVDMGILIKDTSILKDNNYKKKTELYNALYDILSPLVGRTIKRLCNIDIVFLQDEKVNLQLKFHVSKYGIPLFERNLRTFADFKEYVMERYADFAPLRRVFHEAILARI